MTATAPEWITRDICANLSGPIRTSLRTYGYDGDVFTFEAGRMCSSGEGLYTFNTKKAAQLFKLVACNLQPLSDLSPVLLEASRISRLGQSPRSVCLPNGSSNTDLTYTESKTMEQREWPLKYLRRYGSNGNVFSSRPGGSVLGVKGCTPSTPVKLRSVASWLPITVTMVNTKSFEDIDLFIRQIWQVQTRSSTTTRRTS